ncbi:MAG: aminotransferase class IV [Bacteroidia bacterium]|nr:aminotransferase class IV [Bacteroidia bacterium]MCZ2249858.1 aminotransferase class IV [Bacteroidia bacterium]
MSSKFVSHNNQIVSKDSPILYASNRSFCYGDGFFESIRITDNEMPFLQHHFNRIVETAKILEMQLPNDFSIDIIRHNVKSLIEKNEIDKEGKVRINIYRNEGGLYAPENNTSSYIIDVMPLNNQKNGFELNSKGFKVDIFQKIKKPCNILSGVKSCNSLLYVLAGKYKLDNDLDDAVILNEKLNVCEFSGSNLFISINGVLYTPSISEGCVNGVMRNIIIDMAKTLRINVYEIELKPNDLIRADEIFMTNAVNGIQWIGAYKAKRFFNKVSKNLIDALNKFASEQKALLIEN